jgi:hypothetical protein
MSQSNMISSRKVSSPITSTLPPTITTSSLHQTHQQPTYTHSLCPRPSPAYYPCSNSHPPERPQFQHHYRAYRRAKQVVFCRRSVSLPRLCQAHVIWRALPCTPFTCARSASLQGATCNAIGPCKLGARRRAHGGQGTRGAHVVVVGGSRDGGLRGCHY